MRYVQRRLIVLDHMIYLDRLGFAQGEKSIRGPYAKDSAVGQTILRQSGHHRLSGSGDGLSVGCLA